MIKRSKTKMIDQLICFVCEVKFFVAHHSLIDKESVFGKSKCYNNMTQLQQFFLIWCTNIRIYVECKFISPI